MMSPDKQDIADVVIAELLPIFYGFRFTITTIKNYNCGHQAQDLCTFFFLFFLFFFKEKKYFCLTKII